MTVQDLWMKESGSRTTDLAVTHKLEERHFEFVDVWIQNLG